METWVIIIVVAALSTLLINHLFESWFRAKERFVDRLAKKARRGDDNASQDKQKKV